jgi:hypothetical protein
MVKRLKKRSDLEMLLKSCKFWLLLALAMLIAQMALSDEEVSDKSAWDNYKIIVDRNIFSKNRRVYVERQRGEQKDRYVPPPPAPESYFVLRGIVKEDDVFAAFLEDTRGYEVLKVKAGEEIARGFVKSLTIDSLDYEMDGNSVSIFIGNNLQGRASTNLDYDELLEFSEMAGDSTSIPSSSGGSQSSDDNDLLKKLMERRKQELGE